MKKAVTFIVKEGGQFWKKSGIINEECIESVLWHKPKEEQHYSVLAVRTVSGKEHFIFGIMPEPGAVEYGIFEGMELRPVKATDHSDIEKALDFLNRGSGTQ